MKKIFATLTLAAFALTVPTFADDAKKDTTKKTEKQKKTKKSKDTTAPTK
jgi:hypothetical protein